jgi:ATP-dependent Lhr-like helicase
VAKAALERLHPVVQQWFNASFPDGPTLAQRKGWPSIQDRSSTLLLAPTGSGKTLAAFLSAIDELMFSPEPEKMERCRVLYISPLKALGVDVERNLRAPLTGIRALAARDGVPHRELTVGVRSGDTPSSERAKMQRTPPDILITTPESLYLILTSQAREMLRSVDTLIVDEIHSLVPTKRGTHLFLSLERLEALRRSSDPLVRIGLSATQRPLDEIARLLAGGVVDGDAWRPRPVNVIDAGRRRDLQISVEVPVEDMARLGDDAPIRGIGDDAPIRSGPASADQSGGKSIWPSIHPRLVELIRQHRSTMIFVNSRRLAERLAGALNECAEEEIALAHHGSIAKDTRLVIEDRLKKGLLPAIVATSSLELGIDMGAVDLVIQIEAPPSVASGLQRIGRAGHQVGATSKGHIFPKFRGDLLACAAATVRMLEGKVEETYYPRNPLDVLAQQIVAMASADQLDVEQLYDQIRGAASFADLPRSSFEGVLDMLSGRYPSDRFAELRPRITWDRVAGIVEARRGSKRVAIVNGGTIPDRGLYGVFLAGDETKKSRRVGELDEEMVFESRTGDVFLLGASSWRIEDIDHDKVLVSPAPGEPGKMPFWHGDRPGRPAELGAAIGALARKVARMKDGEAITHLEEEHRLDRLAAQNLVQFLAEQVEVTDEVPSDRTIVFERFVDEVGDWRVCILSPFGARVHAPWATAVLGKLEADTGGQVDLMWADDGIVFRLPEADAPPEPEDFFPAPDDLEDLVVRQLGSTSLFAARFRENAGRSLLLPKKHPQKRTPLWAQRRRSADLLSVASEFPQFPIILETYRECLRDVFDITALTELMRNVASRKVRVKTVQTKTPSPFAANLLFSYVANFIYDGDAPLAERRAQALSIDHAQLAELLGEAELRELLDGDVLEQLELRLQRLDSPYPIKHADGVHDLLLSIGDLTTDDIRARAEGAVDEWLPELKRTRRIVEVTIANERRWAAAEDIAKLRDALGVMPPPGLPEAFLETVGDPLEELVARYARTHAPFTAESVADRFGIGVAPVRAALLRLAEQDRVLEGEFIPGGRGTEWVDKDVLRALKRQSLAKLRRQVEPVEGDALARFLVDWQSVARPQRGLDGVLSAVEQLQGAPIPASVLESEILPARVAKYTPSMLDELCAAGEIVWRGHEPLGVNDGRVALYLTDHYPALATPITAAEGELAERVRALLAERGALFYSDLAKATGAFPADLVSAIWALVWAGEVTNDTVAPLRSFVGGKKTSKSRGRPGRSFRSRRLGPPGTEGRWSLLRAADVTPTAQKTALARQLLERYGVLVREAVHAENVTGGFSAVYTVLKAMEESGKIRRGYFVDGLGATQFALLGAEDRLRGFRDAPEEVTTLVLAATDPANPYGTMLPWPEREGARPQRAAGAHVVLSNGRLLAYVGRTEKSLLTFLPPRDPERTGAARQLVAALAELVTNGDRRALLVSKIDGDEPSASELAPRFAEAGFSASSRGFLLRRRLSRA